MSDVQGRVVESIREVIGEGPMSLDDSLMDDLDADSIDCIEIVMELEEDFGIDIPDDVAEKWSTVQDVVDGVVALL